MDSKALLLTTVSAALLAQGAFAKGASTWNVALRGGYADVIENTYTYEFGGPNGPGHYSFNFDSSYILSAAVGWDFAKTWRLELDLSHKAFKAESYLDSLGNAYDTDSEISIWTPSVRISYDVVAQNWGKLAIGVGFGAAHVELTTAPNGEDTTNSDWTISAQVFAELEIKISEIVSLLAEYRVEDVYDAYVENPDVVTTFYENGDFRIQSVLLGLRYRF